MNPKEFFKRWKQGMKEITMVQQLNAKKNGHLGCVIGLSIAMLGFIYRITMVKFDLVQLGFAIFIFFLVWMQGLGYIETKQKLDGAIKMMEEIGDKEILNKL